MPSVKISALTEKTTMVGTEEVLINDSGTSKKFLTQRFLDVKTASETARDAALAAQTAAETAETNAETAETNAATLASNAATSETNASNSASSATAAQSAAEAARDSALASFDSFDDRYLGQKASDPTLDNDGNALVGGTLYFNSTSEIMKVYEGTSWVAAYASLSGALLQTNNLSDLNNAGTARTNLGVDAAGTVNYTHPANHAISFITGLQTALDAKLESVPANSVGASELNVTGNGTAGQYLGSDGDGTMTWTSISADPTMGGDLSGTASNAQIVANAVTDTELNSAKLNGIEAGATADQTNAEIKTAYEANTNTNEFSDAEKTKLAGIATSANNYSLPTASATTLGGIKVGTNLSIAAGVLSSTDTNTTYSVGDGGLSEINFTSADHTKLNGIATSANNYTHPSHPGDDFSVDTGVLSGATVVSDIDINVTTDTSGHVTDANGSVATRTLTLADLGYTGATNANYITNNNQLTNGAGYVTTDTNTTYSADGNYGMTLSGTAFRLENDRRRNATGEDVWSGNTNDYTFYDADVGIRWYTAGVEEMRLENDGDLHVDGNVTAYSTTVSDRNLKTDIENIDNALEKVNKLNGCTFTYTSDGKKSAGLIAQEVEEVLPSAVDTKPLVFHGEEGKEYKVLQYDQTIGLLVEAIKELTTKVEELENK